MEDNIFLRAVLFQEDIGGGEKSFTSSTSSEEIIEDVSVEKVEEEMIEEEEVEEEELPPPQTEFLKVIMPEVRKDFQEPSTQQAPEYLSGVVSQFFSGYITIINSFNYN